MLKKKCKMQEEMQNARANAKWRIEHILEFVGLFYFSFNSFVSNGASVFDTKDVIITIIMQRLVRGYNFDTEELNNIKYNYSRKIKFF